MTSLDWSIITSSSFSIESGVTPSSCLHELHELHEPGGAILSAPKISATLSFSIGTFGISVVARPLASSTSPLARSRAFLSSALFVSHRLKSDGAAISAALWKLKKN